jgi:hypothetical protein
MLQTLATRRRGVACARSCPSTLVTAACWTMICARETASCFLTVAALASATRTRAAARRQRRDAALSDLWLSLDAGWDMFWLALARRWRQGAKHTQPTRFVFDLLVRGLCVCGCDLLECHRMVRLGMSKCSLHVLSQTGVIAGHESSFSGFVSSGS